MAVHSVLSCTTEERNPLVINIHQNSMHFVGRDAKLEEMADVMYAHIQAAEFNSTLCLALYGPTGIGALCQFRGKRTKHRSRQVDIVQTLHKLSCVQLLAGVGNQCSQRRGNGGRCRGSRLQSSARVRCK